MEQDLIPSKIVTELNKYIVGQLEAKRAVAIALRNRWRRQNVAEDLKEDIHPKNILMIGPTGVGKTEIARRLAKLANAPFLKVEATKYTEVGYVGKDVESMVRDLVEISVNMLKSQETQRVKEKAKEIAEEKILDHLVPLSTPPAPGESLTPLNIENSTREKYRQMLRMGELENREITLDAKEKQASFEILAIPGMQDMEHHIRDMLGNIAPKKSKRRKMKVSEAREYLEEEEAQKLIDLDKIIPKAVQLAETNGIIFLDEMDKIAESKDSYRGSASVSREGVQRDLLPIVEGSRVNTKYGIVKTDHILFIGAGAFHQSKPSDLIPELQGRFPIRVELKSLTASDFVRILNEPKNSLIRQYQALLATEKTVLEFTPEAIETICRLATEVNERMENIGARRLHTILERILEEISFSASEASGQTITITPEYVNQRVQDLIKDQDLGKYIL